VSLGRNLIRAVQDSVLPGLPRQRRAFVQPSRLVHPGSQMASRRGRPGPGALAGRRLEKRKVQKSAVLTESLTERVARGNRGF
jgi:hypothetical protein